MSGPGVAFRQWFWLLAACMWNIVERQKGCGVIGYRLRIMRQLQEQRLNSKLVMNFFKHQAQG